MKTTHNLAEYLWRNWTSNMGLWLDDYPTPQNACELTIRLLEKLRTRQFSQAPVTTNAPETNCRLWLTVEVGCGQDIKEACRAARQAADRTGLFVWFDFNGVKCGIGPGENPELLHENWLQAQTDKRTVVCAGRKGGRS